MESEGSYGATGYAGRREMQVTVMSSLMFCTWKQQFSHFSAISYILLHLYAFAFILASHVTHHEHHTATHEPSQYYSHLIRLRQHPVLTSRSAFRFMEHSLAGICHARVSHRTRVTGTCHANLTSPLHSARLRKDLSISFKFVSAFLGQILLYRSLISYLHFSTSAPFPGL